MYLKGRFVKDGVSQPENNFIDLHSHGMSHPYLKSKTLLMIYVVCLLR